VDLGSIFPTIRLRHCRQVIRDNISRKTSLRRVPGLRDKISLKRLCAVGQIYVTILPL